MEKWNEERIEAEKSYVEKDKRIIKSFEEEINKYQKKINSWQWIVDRTKFDMEKSIEHLKEQGWEFKDDEWINCEGDRDMKMMEHGTFEVTQLLAEAKETEENGN